MVFSWALVLYFLEHALTGLCSLYPAQCKCLSTWETAAEEQQALHQCRKRGRHV